MPSFFELQAIHPNPFLYNHTAFFFVCLFLPEVTSYELNPRELLRNSKPSPLPRKTIPGATQLRRSLLRRSKKEPLDIMETELSKTSRNISEGKDDKDTLDPSPDQGFVSDAVEGDDPFVEESMDTVLDTSQFQLRQKNGTKRATPLTAVAAVAAKHTASPRRKTRRSSTSEYLDYAKLTSSSSEREFSHGDSKESNPDPTSAPQANWISDSNLSQNPSVGGIGKDLPAGVSSHSSSSASDSTKPSGSDRPAEHHTQPDTWSSGGVSEDSSINGDGGKEDAERSQRHKVKKVRRFSSCPEYAYTQRVTMTSEESAFIEGLLKVSRLHNH